MEKAVNVKKSPKWARENKPAHIAWFISSPRHQEEANNEDPD
jgi:hypothetical protein